MAKEGKKKRGRLFIVPKSPKELLQFFRPLVFSCLNTYFAAPELEEIPEQCGDVSTRRR